MYVYTDQVDRPASGRSSVVSKSMGHGWLGLETKLPPKPLAPTKLPQDLTCKKRLVDRINKKSGKVASNIRVLARVMLPQALIRLRSDGPKHG